MGPAQKKSSPVIPILIVVVLIAVGVGAFFLLSGDDEAGADPAATVEALYNADNCEALGDILSAESFEVMGGQQAALEACQSQLDEQGGIMAEEGAELVSTEVTSEEESSATVAVELRLPDGETSNVDHELVKEDGEWKVNLAAGGGSGSTPPPGGDDGGGSGPPDASSPDTSLPTDDGSGSGSGGGSDSGSGGGTSGGGATPPMDDPTGDPEDFANAESCQSGDMAACDDLYWGTRVGSDLEAYGQSCGGLDTNPSRPGGDCEDDF